MAENSSFFNSVVDSSGAYDRAYYAEDFAKYFASFIGNGVYSVSDTNLQVVPSSGMIVTVKAGKGFINGYYYENTADMTKTIEASSSSYARIDNICLRLDLTNRYITVVVVKGTNSASPVAPTPTRTTSIYDLVLAQIKVEKNLATITASQITDTRSNSSLCGKIATIVSSSVEDLEDDITTLTTGLASANTEIDNVNADVQEAQVEISELTTTVNSIQTVSKTSVTFGDSSLTDKVITLYKQGKVVVANFRFSGTAEALTKSISNVIPTAYRPRETVFGYYVATIYGALDQNQVGEILVFSDGTVEHRCNYPDENTVRQATITWICN